MLVNMNGILKDAVENNRIVAAFNVFGYEDKGSYGCCNRCNPVILMTSRDAVEYMDVRYFGRLFSEMARDAEVPVCIHLDHAKDFDIIVKAIMAGSSVMYDGSQLPIEENIRIQGSCKDS